MLLKIKIVVLLFIGCVSQGVGQGLLDSAFSNRWSVDSLGIEGFRQKAIVKDSNEGTYLVNGVNILNMRKKEITSKLGKPNFTGTIDHSLPFINLIVCGVNWPYRTRKINYLVSETKTELGNVVHTYLEIEIRGRRVYEVSIWNI